MGTYYDDVRRIYGDEVADLVANGWHVESAIAHTTGTCDLAVCTGEHDAEGISALPASAVPSASEIVNDPQAAPTMTAGQLAAYFASLPADKPVIIYDTAGWYRNVLSVEQAPEDVAAIITATDTYDTRQW